MKLELKHLAGYLPYGLRIARFNQGEIYKKIEYLLRGTNINEVVRYHNLKPILRPISDLTKEDWNSVFVNSDIDNILSIYQSDKHLGCVEYYLVNLLLSHHFDIRTN